ncbi:acetylglutamate kinase [Wohlfahrtiimonas larvae]|uniref:Acetylglutamate kinase n=1 Tax=Wohlfahrtiimonas larvae TaxID=1157986 RepID=A0ABP9MXN8_9GAMM|nr:acetylglutamate kinase [Wohlfahrtiimonas larvae]
MISNQDKAAFLIEALPFIRRYHGKTVVIKYGGSAMVDKEIRQEFIKDIVLMKYVGIHPVIVHGGGPEINQMLERVNKTTEFIEGLRVSDQDTVELAEMVLSAKINKGIVADIQRQGGKAIGLSGKDGNLITAKKKFADKNGEQIDIGFVGEIEKINPDIIYTMTKDNYIPVISSIGMDEDGNTYNINADYVAGAIAAELSAFRLIFLTDVDGIMMNFRDPSTLLKEVDYEEVLKLIKDEVISGGMLPKVRTCLDAIDRGVKNVIILNGKTLHAILLEIFTAEGAGTLIKETQEENN